MPAESLAPVRRWGRTTAAATASLAALGVLSTTGTAHADVVLKLNYPLTGTTTIKSTNSSMSLGPGTLATAVDDTGGLTATVDLPPATGSFKEFGVIPVSVTTEFVEASPTTGTVDINTGAVQTTSHLTIKITELKVSRHPDPRRRQLPDRDPGGGLRRLRRRFQRHQRRQPQRHLHDPEVQGLPARHSAHQPRGPRLGEHHHADPRPRVRRELVSHRRPEQGLQGRRPALITATRSPGPRRGPGDLVCADDRSSRNRRVAPLRPGPCALSDKNRQPVCYPMISNAP